MSESMQLREPLYKLAIRFGNGEMIQSVVTEQVDARMITPETRYAIVSSFSCQNPSECTDITVVNLRDVTFIKTERVTLEQLATERRSAGLHASSTSHGDERMPKTVSQVRFI